MRKKFLPILIEEPVRKKFKDRGVKERKTNTKLLEELLAKK